MNLVESSLKGGKQAGVIKAGLQLNVSLALCITVKVPTRSVEASCLLTRAPADGSEEPLASPTFRSLALRILLTAASVLCPFITAVLPGVGHVKGELLQGY
jgi:hypothetical protein